MIVSFQQNKNRSKKDTGKKNVISFVITSGNPAKPLWFLEKAFDHMAILIDMPVATPRSDRIAFRRNCIFTVCSLNIIKNLIRSICFVGKNITFGQCKARQKFYSYCRIIDISCCKQKCKRIPQRVCKGMNLGVQTASGTSYGF